MVTRLLTRDTSPCLHASNRSLRGSPGDKEIVSGGARDLLEAADMTMTITSSLALVTVLRADCQANGGLCAAGADWATGPGRAQLVVTQTLHWGSWVHRR